jgi:putative membrane protein
MKRTVVIAGITCVMALPGLASAQTTPPAGHDAHGAPAKPAGAQGAAKSTTEGAGTVAAADRTFVLNAARGGMAEVEMGKLAADKAASSDVKQFGQRMADDHSKANEELKSWASKNGITLPTELDAKHKAEQARIAKLSGAAFDRAYITLMVADHNKDVAEFQRESKTAKDPDLKAWAGKTLPTLEEHQKLAKEISAKVAAAPSTDAKK